MSQETQKTIPSYSVDVNDQITHSVVFDSGENNKKIDLADQDLFSVGRFLNVCLTIKHVAPAKQIAVGLALYETTGGHRVIKGHKTFAVAHNRDCCSDITLKNIHFVLPEEIAETQDKTNICSKRTFELDTTSHYIDLDCVV